MGHTFVSKVGQMPHYFPCVTREGVVGYNFDTYIIRFLATYQVMLRAKGEGVPWNPLNSPRSAPVLYFNNNSVSKKS